MDTDPTPPAAPLQGPQLPTDCGPAHRLRPDVAAALIWGPERNQAITADRLISYIRDDELLLVAHNAWFNPGGWGLVFVTSRRLMFLANSTADGPPYALPIEAALWLTINGEPDEAGNCKGSVIDLERAIPMWFTNSRTIDFVNTAVTRAMAVQLQSRPDSEAAHTDNVLDHFSKYSALRRAHEAGALDDEAMTNAVHRMFWPSSPRQDWQ